MRSRVAAIVLAGGRSSRFGSDKLTAAIGDRTLLESAIADLPTGWLVIVVGPHRELSSSVVGERQLITVREEPPGGGPAAALVTGLAAAVAHRVEIVVTLPGDAPSGGRAAEVLVADLGNDPAVLAIDEEGREQPLQFAAQLSTVRRLATRTDAAGMRARDLLGDLGDCRRRQLDRRLTQDVDTREDLARLTEPSCAVRGRARGDRSR